VSEFDRREFPGVVELKEWHADIRTGRPHRYIAGLVSVLTDDETLGFKVNSNDSRWLALVEGPSGERHFFPGCQVRSVIAFPLGAPAPTLDSDVLVVP